MNPNTIRIHLPSIRHNYSTLCQWVGPKTVIMPIVKSDAYGHGMIPVSQTLETLRCQILGVFRLEEGILLRQAGIRIPILLLMGILPDQAEDAIVHDLIPALYQWEIADRMSQVATKYNKIAHVHIKIDTGMARLGVRIQAFDQFYHDVRALPNVIIDGCFSHFSLSEQQDHPFTQHQLNQFNMAMKGITTHWKHIANSGGILTTNDHHFSLARAGIALYGGSPINDLPLVNDLKPVMSFCSKIVMVKTIQKGEPVSYGMTYVADKKTKIATIPVGYDDGYSRFLSNKGEVLVRGKRAPIIGRICMNLTMIDVTHIPGVSINDDVILLGSQGNESISGAELAEKIGTICYEVFCLLGQCNPKVFIE